MTRIIPQIEIEVPKEWFDGWKVYKDGEFLGWYNAKKGCVEKICLKLVKMSGKK